MNTVRQNSTGIGGGNGVWNETTSFPLYNQTVDLSSVLSLNDESTVYFRLSNNTSGLSTGTSQIDNFLVTATAVPEPAAMTLAAAVGLLWFRRRQRSEIKF